jgi:hypothetical protein
VIAAVIAGMGGRRNSRPVLPAAVPALHEVGEAASSPPPVVALAVRQQPAVSSQLPAVLASLSQEAGVPAASQRAAVMAAEFAAVTAARLAG